MAQVDTSYHVVWRPQTKTDLAHLVEYIALDSSNRAETFSQELRNKTLLLAQHPKLSRTGRPGLPDYVRELVVHRNYIIFYRIIYDTHTVEVFRIKHAAQRRPS